MVRVPRRGPEKGNQPPDRVNLIVSVVLALAAVATAVGTWWLAIKS